LAARRPFLCHNALQNLELEWDADLPDPPDKENQANLRSVFFEVFKHETSSDFTECLFSADAGIANP
jgi:hypothetical protein